MEIISDLYNHTLKFTMKFFAILKTNLLTNSNQIGLMLAQFGSNLKEKVYEQIVSVLPFLFILFNCLICFSLFNSISIYFECVTEWFNNVGSNSGFNKYAASIIDTILANIKPIQKSMLTVEFIDYFFLKKII